MRCRTLASLQGNTKPLGNPWRCSGASSQRRQKWPVRTFKDSLVIATVLTTAVTRSQTHPALSSLQDAPYLDLAPYMPDYYKPQYLLDFEDRLPSSMHGSDSLSLNSFNSVTSTNLEWDDSAIAPSSEGQWLFGAVRAVCPHVSPV